jgi:hypothetical protein
MALRQQLSVSSERILFPLRIYSHWVPGMRRVTAAVLEGEIIASNLQAQTVGEEFRDSKKLYVIDFIGGADEDRTRDLLTASPCWAIFYKS